MPMVRRRRHAGPAASYRPIAEEVWMLLNDSG
jgi:hypothetical protein